MAVLSQDDCKLLVQTIDTKLSFQGIDAMKTWLPLIQKLQDGSENGGIATDTSVLAKEQEISDRAEKVIDVAVEGDK